MFTPNGVITLTTDFGLADAYVAIMKGVILGIAPHARIVDYSHAITPGNIVEAAYLLGGGYEYFPSGTIHVVVVDPGVGSDRRAIAVQTDQMTLIGPDNGVLAAIVEDQERRRGLAPRVIELSEPRWWLPNVSATFHGRDVFAPVAAHLVAGTPFEALGGSIRSIVPAPVIAPRQIAGGGLVGQIIHIDRFGNCITNITDQMLNRYDLGQTVVVELIDQQISGLFRTYADGPRGIPMSLIGSSGHLEIAVRNGNAAQYLGVDRGDTLRVRRRLES